MRLDPVFKSFFDMIIKWIHITAGFGSYLSGHRWRSTRNTSKSA